MTSVLDSHSKVAVVVAAIFCGAVGLVVFWPAVFNGFVWDDVHYLMRDDFVDPEYGSKVLSEAFFVSRNYFRPLVVGTYLAQNWMHGPDAFWHHLVNLLLHSLNTAMVVVLAVRLLRSMNNVSRITLKAMVAGLLYGLHPATVEAVVWVSGRFDVLFTTFMLLALVADSHLQNRFLRPLAVGLFFASGAFCKEMAVGFPFVLLAWHLAIAPRRILPLADYLRSAVSRGELQVYGAVVVGGAVYLVGRYISLGYVFASVPMEVSQPGALQTLLLIAKSVGWYLLLAIYPFSFLSPVHPDQVPMSIGDLWAWGSLMLLVVVGGLIFRLCRSASPLGWLFLAFLLSLAPVIHVIPLTIAENIVHERFLLFPLVFAALAAVGAANGIVRNVRLVPGGRIWVSAGWVGVLFYVTLSVFSVRSMIPIWHNDLRLWTWAAQRAPNSATANAFLADQLRRHGMPDVSLRYAIAALKLDAKNASAWSGAGNALLSLNMAEDALKFHRVATLIAPTNVYYLSNFAVSLMDLARYAEAERLLLEAWSIDPVSRLVAVNLTRLYSMVGDDSRATIFWEKARRNMAVTERADVERDLEDIRNRRKQFGTAANSAEETARARALSEARIDAESLVAIRRLRVEIRSDADGVQGRFAVSFDGQPGD